MTSMTTKPVGFIERIPIWFHLPCLCQHNIYSMKHASDTNTTILYNSRKLCHLWYVPPPVYSIKSTNSVLISPLLGITTIDCVLLQCAEHPQRALRHLYGCLSLQIASTEAISPCLLPPTWWICTHSKSCLNAFDRASHSLEPMESRPLFGQCALPSSFIWYWETCSGEAKRTDGCTARRE